MKTTHVPIQLYDFSSETVVPQISVIVPIFNHANSIHELLDGLVCSLSVDFELLMLDDASTDCSSQNIVQFFNQLLTEKPRISRLALWRSEHPMFETRSDNFLAMHSRADVILEVQGDIFIRDQDLGERLLRQFSDNPKILAISGRGGHSLTLAEVEWQECLGASVAKGKSLKFFISRRLLARTVPKFLQSALSRSGGIRSTSSQVAQNSLESFGRVGEDFFSWPHYSSTQKNELQYVETVIRGPLAINKPLFEALGKFNEKRFFLGFDDHDLCARASNFNFKVAYMPMECYSPRAIGATRRTRPWRHELALWAKLISHRRFRHLPLGVSSET